MIIFVPSQNPPYIQIQFASIAIAYVPVRSFTL